MDSKDPASLSDRFSDFYEQLSHAAAELNTASDDLGKPIVALDEFLQRLNLGISTWVIFDGYTDHENGWYENNSVGYAKTSGRWGISISKDSGTLADPERGSFESWLFSDAQRT